MKWFNAHFVVFVVGLASMMVGVSKVYWPAAFIVGGVILMALATIRGRETRAEP